jgi:hypothetical protein
MNRISLIAQMGHVRQQIAGLAEEYGLPNVRSLIVRQRTNIGYQYTAIKPNPVIITESSPQRNNLEDFNNIEVLQQPLMVKGISRRVDLSTDWGYSYEDLVGSGIDYIVDGKLELGKVVGGIICNFESITEKTIHWDMKLIYNIGEQSIYKEKPSPGSQRGYYF